jgi:hypothetical protein
MAAPDTGSWQTFRVVSKSGISLSAGTHTIRLEFDAGSTQNGGNVDFLRFR